MLLTDGDPALDAPAQQRLRRNGIAWRCERIARLEGRDGRLQRIVFADGSELERSGLFYHLGCDQASDLPARLGCRFDDRGFVTSDMFDERTCIAGLYVIGDASHDALLISVAAAEGVKAAIDINKRLTAAAVNAA